VEVDMWKPWQQVVELSRASNERAIGNARAATTTCSRARVEREAVELFLRSGEARVVPASGASQRPA
jgi:hypothetical protein